MDRPEDTSVARGAAQFATTHWSVVLSAGEAEASESSASLERLCRTYWYPLYAFVRRKGYSPEDAEDLTQGFFERLLEKHFLKEVDPALGRFRTFLLTALKHFLANEWDRVKAVKRGGNVKFVPLDSPALEERFCADASGEEPPERRFDRLWAEAVMDRALAALEEEHRTANKVAQFEVFAEFLSRPPEEDEYARVGATLRLNSHAVAVAVSRMRERYQTLIRTEIAHTVANAQEVDAELRYLIDVISA